MSKFKELHWVEAPDLLAAVRVREVRRDRGITATALARKLHIDRVTLHRYETGERLPTIRVALATAAILGEPVTRLWRMM
jgi:DNA-binding XRE family transcriptional regulator